MTEWQDRTPLLYEVLQTVAGDTITSKTNQSVAVSGSILLHHRNQQMSAIQQPLSQIAILCHYTKRNKILRITIRTI
jgi:ABC-type molybdate transport system ATPase subunit